MLLNCTGHLLTETELRILNIALAEHLRKLEKSGLNLNLDHQHNIITKEEVVTHLQKFGQQELAKILSEDRGKLY